MALTDFTEQQGKGPWFDDWSGMLAEAEARIAALEAVGRAQGATSTTNLANSVAVKTFDLVEADHFAAFAIGDEIEIDRFGDATVGMIGEVTALVAPNHVTISVSLSIGGAGPFNNWVLRPVTPALLPPQAGNAGKFLKTDGAALSYASPLPDPTGHAGLFLQTADGVTQTWADIGGGAEVISGATLVANGVNPATTASWAAINAALSIVASALRVLATAANGNANQAIACTVGDTYTVQLDVAAISGGLASYGIGTVAGTNDIVSGSRGSTGAAIQLSFVATQATHYLNLGQTTNGQSADYNNVSVNLTTHKLTAASKRLLYCSGLAFAMTLVAPDATGMRAGVPTYFLKNAGALPVVYRDNALTFLFGIPGGERSLVALQDNSAAAGNWLRHSSAEIGALVGKTVSQWRSGAAVNFDMCLLDATHQLRAYMNGTTAVQIDCSVLNADGSIASTGGSISFANAGATLVKPRIVGRLSATQVIVSCYDQTNTKVIFIAVNIAGTVVSFPDVFKATASAVNSWHNGAAYSATHFAILYINNVSGHIQTLDCAIVTATGVITTGVDTDTGQANATNQADIKALSSTAGVFAMGGVLCTIAGVSINGANLPVSVTGNVDVWIEQISTTGFILAADQLTGSFAKVGLWLVTNWPTRPTAVAFCEIPSQGGGISVLKIRKVSANRLAVLVQQQSQLYLYTVAFNELNGDMEVVGRGQYVTSTDTANLDWLGVAMEVQSPGKLIIAAKNFPNSATNSMLQIEVTQ